MSATALEPIRKTIAVARPVEDAFETFTAEMGTWWPLLSHSVGGEDAETVEVEGRAGGQVVEHIRGGRTAVWADVLVWEPPHRVVLSWYPGRGPAEATEVEVSFQADGDRTRVVLEHRGWERITAERAAAARPSYRTGWDLVL